MIFLFLWFRASGERRERQSRLLATILVSIAAIVAGRALALLFPFRLRPMHSGIDPTLAPGVRPEMLDGWSSMPSDHAVLFFALAAAFWQIQRWAGLLMLLHALLAVAFVRVYFSLHWPSDILVGAAVGVGIAAVLVKPAARAIAATGVFGVADRHPEWLHPILFLALFQLVTMFESARAVIEEVASLVI
jgi:undecaprenyl-diphosphatase